MPRIRSVSDVKANLLRPALTSHYEVYIGIPTLGPDGETKSSNFVNYLQKNKINWNISQDKIQLACSEALLPGSSFATHELTGDRTGVTERHVYRRVYDDRIDLTFYVDIDPRDPYVSIRFFETWMKFVTNESIAGSPNIKDGNFSYQVRYPIEYYGSLKITKFERTGKNNVYTDPNVNLIYNFVQAFPISVSSMPISYESSQLLKVTVSFSYIRYYVDEMPGDAIGNTPGSVTPTNDYSYEGVRNQALSPTELSAFNLNSISNSFYRGTQVDTSLLNTNFGSSSTGFGGIPTWALSGKAALINQNSPTLQQQASLLNRGIVSGGTVGGVDANTIGNTQGFDANVG